MYAYPYSLHIYDNLVKLIVSFIIKLAVLHELSNDSASAKIM